jgi:hypothetical protein
VRLPARGRETAPDRSDRLWQDLGVSIVGTVPGAFASARHGRVGLHVMYLDLG